MGATAPRLLLEVVLRATAAALGEGATESALLLGVERIETRLDMSIPAPQAVPRRRLRLPSETPAAREPRPVQPHRPRANPPWPRFGPCGRRCAIAGCASRNHATRDAGGRRRPVQQKGQHAGADRIGAAGAAAVRLAPNADVLAGA